MCLFDISWFVETHTCGQVLRVSKSNKNISIPANSDKLAQILPRNDRSWPAHLGLLMILISWPDLTAPVQLLSDLGHVWPDQLRSKLECQRMADLGMVLQYQVTLMLGLRQVMPHASESQLWTGRNVNIRFVPGLTTPDLMADLGQV